MRRAILLILLTLLTALSSHADIPVIDPETRIDPRVTRESLEAQLKPLSEAKKVQRVQRLLQNLYPQLRLAEQIIKNIDGLDPKTKADPRFSKEYEKYQSDAKQLRVSEAILKEWLQRRGIKPEPERGPSFRKRESQNPETHPVVGSTHLIALAFLAGVALLGLRRFLA